MKTQLINQQELEIIQKFLNEESMEFLDSDILTKFQSLYFGVMKKIASTADRQRKENSMLRSRLNRINARAEQKAAEGVFQEKGLDSVDVATMLLYHLQNLQTYKLSKTKLIHILYGMYCTWLEKKERLFSEHPVATEWGPQFWRVYKRIDTRVPVPVKDYNVLAQKYHDVAAFSRICAEKYYDYDDATLKNKYVKSFPYENALPNRNNGKWNMEISDADIYAWKKNLKLK